MRKGLLAVFGLIVLAGVAWWAGVGLGKILVSPDKEKKVKAQKKFSDSFLEKNQSLNPGDRWPDVTLQSLDGDWISFSQVVRDTTLIIVIQPGCEACETELDVLDQQLVSGEAVSRILIVSAGHPLDLAQIRKKRNIQSTILVDRVGELFTKLNSVVYPLNFIVTGERTIVSVTAGVLTKEQAETLLH